MNTEERVKLIEEAMLLMKSLLVRHDERLDDFDETFRRSREDFDFKMTALIDAQMKNESEIAELKESTTELRKSTTELRELTSKLNESTSNLKDASRSQLKRIERLEQI
ncbi:MAG: hypothetical protein ABIV48_13790 [Pyrinomonadaceae bacterium]